ncbi:hypothetical protein PMKS-002298 [Pichia membranifaciens]|uniref:Uncharacterized protein n=1 Tax=Pichia membranifaciens TaxID=4926 RepID=A0A1Q2YH15_9ASCO|nr:hypothetical protein PMKS-002298 [Pichia membranifaciens]
MSRSHSRGRSRSRDASPFSLDSRLSSSYNQFQVPVGRDPKDYVPILEDDESNIELGPVLPQFSSNAEVGPGGDADLDKVPLPAVVEHKETTKEIEEDFRKQFEKDAKVKDVMKNREKDGSRPRATDSKNGSGSGTGSGTLSVSGSDQKQQQQTTANNEATADHGNSSPDYSTDSQRQPRLDKVSGFQAPEGRQAAQEDQEKGEKGEGGKNYRAHCGLDTQTRIFIDLVQGIHAVWGSEPPFGRVHDVDGEGPRGGGNIYLPTRNDACKLLGPGDPNK